MPKIKLLAVLFGCICLFSQCKKEATACFESPASAQANQKVLINSCAVYGRGELTMDFGDGSELRTFDPLADTISHVYSDTGSFSLTMLATNGKNSHQLTKTIRIIR